MKTTIGCLFLLAVVTLYTGCASEESSSEEPNAISLAKGYVQENTDADVEFSNVREQFNGTSDGTPIWIVDGQYGSGENSVVWRVLTNEMKTFVYTSKIGDNVINHSLHEYQAKNLDRIVREKPTPRD